MELIQAKKILTNFNIKEAVLFCSPLKNGLINRTYKVVTKETTYVIQALNIEIFPNYKLGLENIILIKHWLKQKKFPYIFPSPIFDKYLELNGEIWRVLPFIKK